MLVMASSVSRMLHWHAVYKISTVSSPTHELSSENDGYEMVQNKFSTNKRLSLLMSNMKPEDETSLRSILLNKLNKFETLSTGSEVISVDSFLNQKPSQIYYNTIFHTLSNAIDFQVPLNCFFLVSFMVETESGFELFQKDLDDYCNSLLLSLEKYMESIDVSEYLTLLDEWYDSKVCFIERCLQYFSKDLALLLCASFCSISVTIDPKIPDCVKKDIQRFLECSSLSLLFDEINNSKYLLSLNESQVLHVSLNSEENSYSIVQGNITSYTTPFAFNCIRSLEEMKFNNPIKMRQLIENYKVKIIQDINSFHRLIKQAENDYYALYKAYIFIASSGNAYVIIKNARLQNCINNETNIKHLLNVLEQFIEKMGGFDAISSLKGEPLL
ncbi:protein Njmu-R1 isoform X2 [Hydra vulgaris]|uniref:protein Njmu-R1 isoform X2 n=1 Tax=Hydra vulgaris TaxID=6087 RepID=UPI001F5F0A4F|nr:protein Njmu-R1 isoform X2 [Hydra vulgaris]